MQTDATNYPDYRQWRLLLIYDLYRLITLLLFGGVYLYGSILPSKSSPFITILLVYFFCSILFLSLWHQRKIGLDKQVLISGTVDILAIVLLLSMVGNSQSGYGILLNVIIAALSILVPGRLAIFFAAFASCLLLSGNIIQYLYYHRLDLGSIFDNGIYGTGFFATAITAWYLANWVRHSESLALHRSKELAAMQRINEYIVERLHSGIIYVDETKQIKLINSAARELLEINQNITPQSLQEISPLLAEKFDHFIDKMKQNDDFAQTLLEESYLRIHFFSTEVANKPAVLIILEDLTLISQQAQQLKLAALGRFSASIAHELRNPLGAISHAVQLLGEDGKLSDEDKRLKQLVIKNCDRMNGVIKNVLQLSRREQAQPQVIEIKAFLEQFTQEFSNLNRCEYRFSPSQEQGEFVIFDKSQLEQILVILSENAIQHGRNDEGKVCISVSTHSIASKTILKLSDDGPGITDEHRDNIFEPFYTTLRSGTGMGLFIARDLCEINKARLSLEKTHKGCCFAITLNTSDELLI